MLGLMIESVVALMLLVTIGYCVVLNSRLKRLRADESSLRETIGELVRATEIAERAIEGLKQTAAECDRDLTNKLRQADRFSRSIEKQVELGGKVLTRLSRISELARGHGLVERGAAPATSPATSSAATPSAPRADKPAVAKRAPDAPVAVRAAQRVDAPRRVAGRAA